MTILKTALSTVAGYGRYGLASLLSAGAATKRPLVSSPHLAILAWSFAPDINGGVYRPAALARYAREAGHSVTVIAGAAPRNPTVAGINLRNYVGAGVEIVRTKSCEPPPSYRLFPKLDGGLHSALALFFAARTHFANKPPDVIIATGPPFHVFVAGYWLSRLFGARLVLDYRDEWTLCPFDFVYAIGRFNLEWELRCLDHADHVILATQSFRNYLLKEREVPHLAQKCHVVPNGWEPSESLRSERQNRIPTGKLVLLHAGALGGHTSARPFLTLLAGIFRESPELAERVVIRFVGTKHASEEEAIQQFPFPGVIENIPQITMQEATKQMASADVLLLLLDVRFKRYRPGKLYEYLASGTPILVFDDQGESSEVVSNLAAGWTVPKNDGKALKAALLEAESGFPPPLGGRQEWLLRHSRKAITRDFLDIISHTS